MGEVLQGLDWENYNYPNYSYTEAAKLGMRIVNLLYAHDPELNAARREYYASLGKEPPLYYEGEGELVMVRDDLCFMLRHTNSPIPPETSKN